MLGLQGNASAKEYRCVACSASFSGLASLLVHQATHAGSLPKSPQRPSAQVHASSTSSNTEEKQASKFVSPPMYICDCGKEFRDFTAMMYHKQSHAFERQPSQSNNRELTEVQALSNTYRNTSGGQVDMVFGEDSTVSIGKFSSFVNTEAAESQDHNAASTSTEDQSSVSAESDKQCDNSLLGEHISDEAEDNAMDDKVPKNKSLMTILATAYGKHLVSPPSEDNNIAISLKEETEVVVITPPTSKGPSNMTDSSTMQLKRLLGKPGMKTKAPSISRLLESSTKKIVSLTKIFSPVVVLETRQKFMDPGSDGYGKYQCSRCRKVFQDVDSLTDHHFMHKKERIKCCRHCKQLIIGRVPLPDNHICPQSRGKTTVSSLSLKKTPINRQKVAQINNPNNRKKVYFCPICQHNYARRYNLKMHKCRGPVSSQSQQTTSLNTTAEACLGVGDECNSTKSMGIGTPDKRIKIEENEGKLHHENNLSKGWGSPSSTKEKQTNASVLAASFLHAQDSSWSRTADNSEVGSESQWTMPLNSDMDLPATTKDSNIKEFSESMSVSHSDTRRTPRNYFVKDGVRRYPCAMCRQTFSSSCSLSRHEKVCSMNPISLGDDPSCNTTNAINLKMYPCYVCGRNFNRKDNMMVHRKRCEQRRTMIPNLASEIKPSSPPPNATNTTLDQTEEEEEEGDNWSIMSLPSVLPRRVTCECGVGFTSPKLLLEHLQKHAQESYTCPTCGLTVNSWADYEVHLQLHMHPQHQKQPQPLLLRFKHPTFVQKITKPLPIFSEKQPLLQETFKRKRKQQRSICSKCGKSFASRCSLRRHISWNRCKALRTTLANKTYHCSLCSTDFPNAISLLFHQRGGTCKPAIKPVRCPICLRWFTTTDGLQKHLLAHKNSEIFRCDVCQGSYPSLKSLKIHRRRIHRIMVRPANSDSEEQDVQGSFSG